MKKISIQGKSYVQVHTRILEFHKLYPGGHITTNLVQFDPVEGHIIMQAIVTPDSSVPERYFTGHAFEFRDDKSSFVNKASFVENCETSAIGRALGALGIGIDDGFASADEVSNKQGRAHKPWYNDFDKHRSAMIEKLEGGTTNEEILSEIKEKYKVSKKTEDAILKLTTQKQMKELEEEAHNDLPY